MKVWNRAHGDLAGAQCTDTTHGTQRRVFNVTLFCAIALMVLTSFAALRPMDAGAEGGQIGTINAQGVALMVHPTDQSVIEWMDAGVPVDILFGPYEDMYQVRYYGIDGWVWAEYVTVDGVGGVTESSGSSAGASSSAVADSEEHWIDVNRSSGAVTLMIGDAAQATYWGSLGWDESDNGFYSTAVGTYYVYAMQKPLHYTEFADNYIDHWIAFDPDRYNGFHSYTKDENGDIVANGAGNTGGCVALGPGAIDDVWAFSFVGMRVEIHN